MRASVFVLSIGLAVLPMGAPAGELSAAAAAELSLKPGIPVAQGGIDAYAGMFGVGVVRSSGPSSNVKSSRR